MAYGPTNVPGSAIKAVSQRAEAALETAEDAQRAAQAAEQTAGQAQTAAQAAQSASQAARETAQSAQTAAQEAKTTAQTAQSAAQEAKTTAQTAQTAAQNAQSAAQTAAQSAQNAAQTAASSGVTAFNGRKGAVAPQSGDYTAAQVGAVPTTRKVNGKPLSADISLSASDVGAAASAHSHTASSVGARPSTWTPSAADVGAVPTTRKVNGKPLSADISLNASDVGAAAASHTHTLSQITDFATGSCQIYSLSYTGDGGGSKTVTFPHKPMAVFVHQVELPCYEMRMLQGSKCCFCHGPMTEWPSNVSWSGKSVTWSKVVDDRYSYSVEYMCNASGKSYRLIALLDASQ